MIAPDPAPAGPRPATPVRPEAAGGSARDLRGRDFGSVLTERLPHGREPDLPDAVAAIEAVPVPPAAIPDAAIPVAPAAGVAGGGMAVAEAVARLPSPAAGALPAARQATIVPAEAGSGSGSGKPEAEGNGPFAARHVETTAAGRDVQRPAATEPAPSARAFEAAPRATSLDVAVAPADPALSDRREPDAVPVDPAEAVVRGDAASGASVQPPAAAAAAVTTREGGGAEPAVVLRDAAAPGWLLAPELGVTHARNEPAAPQAPQPQAVIGQVAVAISKASDRKIEIRLDPPELGRVQIHLSPTDNGVQAVVMAQRPETQDLLRRHAETLVQELIAAGYGSVTLDFAAGGEATPGHDDAPANDRHYAASAPAAVEAAVVAGPQRQLAGGLDIRL